MTENERNHIKAAVEKNCVLNEVSFQKSSLFPKAVMVFVVVNGTNADLTDADICKEIEIIKNYEACVLNKNNSLYVEISSAKNSGETAYKTLINSFNEKVQNNKISNLNNWGIVPIFVDNDSLDNAILEYQSFNSRLSGFLKNKQYSYRQMPSVLLNFERGSSEYSKLLQSLLELKKSWNYSLPILVIYPSSDSGYIEYDSRIKTIYMTSCFQMLTDCFVYYLDNDNYQCYASRLLTICKPYHVELLHRVNSLLKFFLKKPEKENTALSDLGNKLSSVPYETVWNRWKSLPCKVNGKSDEVSPYENKTISIKPVYSLLFPKDYSRDDLKQIFNEFAEKYYRSKLSIDATANDSDTVRNKFFDNYKHSYGSYITGFEELFSTTKVSDFIKNRIVTIPVDDIEGSSGITYFDPFKDKLSSEIQERTRAFYRKVLSDDCVWYKTAKYNYEKLREFIQVLSEIIEQLISHWQGIEGNMSFSEIVWEESFRKTLTEEYIKLLNSESLLDDFCGEFVDKLFTKIQDNMDSDLEGYLNSFNLHIKESNVKESLKRLLTVGRNDLAPLGNSLSQNVIFVANDLPIEKEILSEINGAITHNIPNPGVKDRIEYLAITEVCSWNMQGVDHDGT